MGRSVDELRESSWAPAESFPPGVGWPEVDPEVGEPFVEWAFFESRQERNEYVWATGPTPPEARVAVRWDEDTDEPIEFRDRTPEEMAEMTARYEKALAKWRKNGGRYFSPGPLVTGAFFRTASKRVARAQGDGQRWIVTELWYSEGRSLR